VSDASTAQPAAANRPAAIVREFLEALEANDLERAMPLLAEDAEWINVSLPTVRGRGRIEAVSRRMLGLGVGFRVHFHELVADGDTVLTERSDELAFGPVAQRFWVYGRFELRDGKIAIWRDSFDWGDVLVSLLRAIAGAVRPGLNRPWPLRR
jgi:limonene-1,2-epoxide hydrolase